MKEVLAEERARGGDLECYYYESDVKICFFVSYAVLCEIQRWILLEEVWHTEGIFVSFSSSAQVLSAR